MTFPSGACKIRATRLRARGSPYILLIHVLQPALTGAADSKPLFIQRLCTLGARSVSILKLAENFFVGDSPEIPPEAYCKHKDFPAECRYCAANELGERVRKEWPFIPWRGLTGAMIKEANSKTYSKGCDGQNVMF